MNRSRSSNETKNNPATNQVILDGKRLKDYEFRIQNEEGGVIEFRAKLFDNIVVYTILAGGKLSRNLISSYLEYYDSSLRKLRTKDYTIIGAAYVYKVILPDSFTEEELVALSNGLSSIVQGDILISMGDENFKSKTYQAKALINTQQSSTKFSDSLYNKYLRFIGARSFLESRLHHILHKVEDVEDARNFAQRIVGSSHAPDLKSGILSLGYQIIFKLPKAAALRLPKNKEELEILILGALEDISPENFESKKAL